MMTDCLGAMLGNVEAILVLSSEDLGTTWVQLGIISGHAGAIRGLSLEDLGATWDHLGA